MKHRNNQTTHLIMTTLLSLLPQDLKIELERLNHKEKFKLVKQELKLVTRQLYRSYKYLYVSSYETSVIRPAYIKSFPENADLVYYKQVGLVSQSFIWGLCKDRTHDVIENTFSIAGKNHKAIKEYLNKNESSR
jgi:hypothetical protein